MRICTDNANLYGQCESVRTVRWGLHVRIDMMAAQIPKVATFCKCWKLRTSSSLGRVDPCCGDTYQCHFFWWH